MSMSKYQSFFDKPNLGRERSTMPQVDADDIDSFIIHFSNHAGGKSKGVEKKRIRIGDLNPSQNEIDEEKVNKMEAEGYDWRARVFLISKDKFVIDGHHALALGLLQDPDAEVDCYVVNLKGKELLRRTNLLKISRKEDLNGNEVKKSQPIVDFLKNLGKSLH